MHAIPTFNLSLTILIASLPPSKRMVTIGILSPCNRDDMMQPKSTLFSVVMYYYIYILYIVYLKYQTYNRASNHIFKPSNKIGALAKKSIS